MAHIATIPFGSTGKNWVVNATGDLYPVKVFVPEIDSAKYGLPLSRAEAQSLLEALEDALEYDPTPYVRVKLLNGATSRLYTYRDVSGTLEVGDLVEVPVGISGTQIGRVAKLGRGDYKSKVKDVTSKLVTEPLVAA